MREKLSTYKFIKLATESFKNGLRLHFDSILLFENQSYPSAFQLSVLALEEFSKSYWVEHYYYLSITNEGFPDKEFEQKWLGLLYFHPKKQRAFFGWGISRDYSPKFIESIENGGIQDKPTVINLWFIECRGCVAEVPALNRLHEKYVDKINFIALTFDNESEVGDFLDKTPYNFIHIASKDRIDKKENIYPFIKTIESYPYPENIFIDRQGTIKYIEGGLSNMEDLDMAIQHFELIIQDLLNAKPDNSN